MSRDRLRRVGGTARGESTDRTGAEEEQLGRRKDPPVETDQAEKPDGDGTHGVLVSRGLSRDLDRSVRRSRSTPAKPTLAIEGRATRTISAGCVMPWRWIRKASRIHRRARERPTAGPTLRLVTTPSRVEAAGDQFITRHPQTSRRPVSLRRRKSEELSSRRLLGKVERTGPLMDAAVAGSDRGEALAAHAAAVVEGGATALGGHAGPETMLALTADLRRLVLTFHCSWTAGRSAGRAGQTMEGPRRVKHPPTKELEIRNRPDRTRPPGTRPFAAGFRHRFFTGAFPLGACFRPVRFPCCPPFVRNRQGRPLHPL